MVNWLDQAKNDLKKIFDYISEDSKYYAYEVIEKMIEETENLDNFLNSGKIVPKI